MKERRILILGAGAQAKYACSTLRASASAADIVVFGTEGSPALSWPEAYGARYEAGDERINAALEATPDAAAALVCLADPVEKARMWARVEAAGLSFLSAIHPGAFVDATARVGEGAIVNAGAVIQPFAEIGRGAMIHAGAIVEHDCRLGDFINLAPGCRLAGWVQVGSGATLYTGSSVIPGRSIGVGAVVGAGAVVIQDVPPGRTAVGVPARVIEI